MDDAPRPCSCFQSPPSISTTRYGVGPLAVEAFIRDLKDKYQSIRYKDALMTMDFLKGYCMTKVFVYQVDRRFRVYIYDTTINI